MIQYCRYPLPENERVSCVAPRGAVVALGTDAGTLWLLDSLEGARSGGVRVEAHTSAVRCVAWDAAGLVVATGAADATIVVHSRTTASPLDAAGWEKVDEFKVPKPADKLAAEPDFGAWPSGQCLREACWFCHIEGGASVPMLQKSAGTTLVERPAISIASWTGRGGAAAAAWIVRGRVAAAPRLPRG